MRIAVFGAGGVGGYFGGRLAQAGEEVVFIARGDHLKAICANGLRVDSLIGDFLIKPVEAWGDPTRVGQVDVVLVGVKAWQVLEAAQAMRPMIGPETFVVPLQNGVDAPAQLVSVLGKEHVFGGVCRIVSFIAGPGYIRHTGIEPYIAFGELDKGPSRRARRLRKAFEDAEVSVEIPPDIWGAIWEKFLFIAAISGVGAVTRASIGEVRALPETRQLLVRALEEIAAVARALKVSLTEGVVEKTLAFIDNLPENATTSMQRDIIEGRPSELVFQNGAVVRLGLERGVPTPVHTFIYHSLLPQELLARGEL